MIATKKKQWLGCAIGVALLTFGASRGDRHQTLLEAKPSPPKLRVLSDQRGVWIRSPFSDRWDLVRTIGKGANGQINFHRTYLVDDPAAQATREPGGKAILIHACGDDSTPWSINGTYIGGNHGCSDGRGLTIKNHGLTTDDIGSAWKDEAGETFYVIKIVDPDNVWVLSENKGEGPIWKFNKTIKGNELKRVPNGEILKIEANKMIQITPACRIKEQKYLADGETPLEQGKEIECDFLDVVEDYDIINPGSLLTDIIKNPGEERDFAADHLEAVINNHIIYQFQPNGACVVTHKSTALQPFHLGAMGFIQSAALQQGSFQTHDYYIPKTRPFVRDGARYDFRSVQDFRNLPEGRFYFSLRDRFKMKDSIESPENLPDRFIQFLGSTNDFGTSRDVGYAIGYSLINGITIPKERAKRTSMALALNNYTSKTYPYAVRGWSMKNPIPAGTVFDCVAYRHYFDPTAFKKPTCVYWHQEGDAYVVYIDYHRSVDGDVVKLPGFLVGKPFSVVEKTPSVTLSTKNTIPSEGLAISVRDGYGYLVLKVDEGPSPESKGD